MLAQDLNHTSGPSQSLAKRSLQCVAIQIDDCLLTMVSIRTFLLQAALIPALYVRRTVQPYMKPCQTICQLVSYFDQIFFNTSTANYDFLDLRSIYLERSFVSSLIFVETPYGVEVCSLRVRCHF